MDENGARQRVEAELARWRQSPGHPDVVIDTVTEHRRAWVVTYGTPEFRATRDARHQLAGAAPLIVDKRTGTGRAFGSTSSQRQIFRGWLDDRPSPQVNRPRFVAALMRVGTLG